MSLMATPPQIQKLKTEEATSFACESDDCILLNNIPIGQPNPKGLEPKRVMLKAQDGPSCYLNALKRAAIVAEGEKYFYVKDEKIIADRKAVSNLRKGLKKLDKYNYLSAYAEQFLEMSGIYKTDVVPLLRKKLSKVTAKDITYHCLLLVFANLEKSSVREKIQKRISTAELKDLVDKFYKSDQTDLMAFLKGYLNNARLKESINVHVNFLVALGKDPETEIMSLLKPTQIETPTPKKNEPSKEEPSKSEPSKKVQEEAPRKTDLSDDLKKGKFGDLNLVIMDRFLKVAIQRELRRIFDFEYIKWDPATDSMDVLVKLLKDSKAPLVFFGGFGSGFYKPGTLKKFNVKETKELRELEKFDLKQFEFCGWNRADYLGDDLLKDFEHGGHVVDVVGFINNKTNQRVIIWDPNFPSDPALGKNSLTTLQYDVFRKRCMKSSTDAGYGLQRRIVISPAT